MLRERGASSNIAQTSDCRLAPRLLTDENTDRQNLAANVDFAVSEGRLDGVRARDENSSPGSHLVG
jgi:hypothetical protein